MSTFRFLKELYRILSVPKIKEILDEEREVSEMRKTNFDTKHFDEYKKIVSIYTHIYFHLLIYELYI